MNYSTVTVLATLLGAAWGSFLAAWLYRYGVGRTVVKGRSSCVTCQATLAWFELIPVISFLVLRGRCRRCKALLSVRYLVVEAATAIFFGVTAYFLASRGVVSWSWLVTGLVAVFFLSFIFFFELYYSIVWSGFLVIGMIGVLVGNMLLHIPFLGLIAGALVGGGFFFAQWLISDGRWVGEGDIFIGFFMGFLLGWQKLLLAFFLAYVGGAFIAVLLLAAGWLKRKDKIQFGSFLAVSTWVAWLYGADIIGWYMTMMRS